MSEITAQRDKVSGLLGKLTRELSRIGEEVARATASMQGPAMEECLGRAIGSLQQADQALCDAYSEACVLSLLERTEKYTAAVDAAREQREAYERSKEQGDLFERFQAAERERNGDA